MVTDPMVLERNQLTEEAERLLVVAPRGVHVFGFGTVADPRYSWSADDDPAGRIPGSTSDHYLQQYSSAYVAFGALVDHLMAAGLAPWEGQAGQSGVVYPRECVLPIEGGNLLCTEAAVDDATRAGVSYVRVCDRRGLEIMYWNVDEWAEDPAAVMGAILGAARDAAP